MIARSPVPRGTGLRCTCTGSKHDPRNPGSKGKPMTSATTDSDAGPKATTRPVCPAWCVTRHNRLSGEDDWLHMGEPVELTARIIARVCMTVEPETGAVDGPYVLIGHAEFTLDQAAALAGTVLDMAVAA